MTSNKERFRRFMDEVMVGGNTDLIDDYIDEKFVEHEELPPGFPEGREAVVTWIQMMHTAFSDLSISVEDIVEDGDTIWARWRMHGTHSGEFMGIPATGKSFDIGGIDIVRLQDGKTTEHWGVTDMASLLMQIGALPTPE